MTEEVPDVSIGQINCLFSGFADDAGFLFCVIGKAVDVIFTLRYTGNFVLTATYET